VKPLTVESSSRSRPVFKTPVETVAYEVRLKRRLISREAYQAPRVATLKVFHGFWNIAT
jgi:hypothetical protein